MELKNRTNTDNASAKKSNLDKLSEFKKNHPDYTCIYATINATTEEKTLKGGVKKILHNQVEIEQYTGYALLEFVFKENTEVVLIVHLHRVCVSKSCI